MRVKLSHPNTGDIGEGVITFGYSCLAKFQLDGFGFGIQLNVDQLATGLLAVAGDGRRLSLFNCECRDRTLYPEFVIAGDIKAPQFDSFEVRYSNVSDWFFRQMHVDGQPGTEVKWRELPAPLVADVSSPGHSFKSESFYVGSLEQDGEDRTLHQHFEFRFKATHSRFSATDVKPLALRFSNLLSILLAQACPIISVDVSVDGKAYARMYYRIFNAPPNEQQPKDDRDRFTWLKLFAQKCDIDGCWENIVNGFFRSKYREVIWSRLAGMQNYEGFWEYRVLGYVSLLDS